MNSSDQRRLLCAALLCWLVADTKAAAECELRLDVGNVDWRGTSGAGYRVFDPGEHAQPVNFKIHLVGEPCPFFVTFSSGISGENRRRASSAEEELEYEVHDSIDRRIILKDLPGANGNEVIQGTFAPGETVKELSYAIFIPAQQVKPAGLYTDLLKVTVHEGTPDSFIERDSRTVTFSVIVEEVTELVLVTSGAPFDPQASGQTLDFDKLAKGKAKGFDLRVRSNTGYQVQLASEYDGVMKHTDPSVLGTIPYSMKVKGAPVNLRGGQQTVLSGSPRLTGRDGDRHEVEVMIGDTAGAAAGTYRDFILVTVISDS